MCFKVWVHSPDQIGILEMLVFEARGKPELNGEKPQCKDENNNKLNPHKNDAESGNRTQATLVRGECAHHCAKMNPKIRIINRSVMAQALQLL